MRLRDFHIKRCIVCGKICWTELGLMFLGCFDKVDKVIHADCFERWYVPYPDYRGCP